MASSTVGKLQLHPRSWYGWQVLDGRSPVAPPWNASPIFIKSVKPLKTGRGELAVEFIAALRHLRPIQANAVFRIEHHTTNVITGTWRERDAECVVAITHATMDWLTQYCAPLLQGRPPYALIDHGVLSTGYEYLETLFGKDEVSVLSAPSIDAFLVDAAARPTRVERHNLPHRYEGMDAWLVIRGFAPAAMEQKWCVRSEERGGLMALAIYRSWTGFPVWRWTYEVTATGIEFSTVEIGDNPDFYTPSPWPRERHMLRAVVEDVLLGRPEFYSALIDSEDCT